MRMIIGSGGDDVNVCVSGDELGRCALAARCIRMLEAYESPMRHRLRVSVVLLAVALSTGLFAGFVGAQPRLPWPLPPTARTAGDLVVLAPIDATEPRVEARTRTHVAGPWNVGARRVWVGPLVPAYVPLSVDTLELFLLDHDASGAFALYRDPVGASSCRVGSRTNCAYVAAYYDASRADDAGEVPLAWRIRLDALFSRREQLEIQDIRLDDGVLYFNEACAASAREAGGRCSSLVAFDPRAGHILWRTPPLVSNAQIGLTPLYVVVGYGFVGETSYVSLVRRSDGRVLVRQRVPEPPGDLRVEVSPAHGPRFEVVYDVRERGRTRMHIIGAGSNPRLLPVSDPAAAARTAAPLR